jgi:hypothetical protein
MAMNNYLAQTLLDNKWHEKPFLDPQSSFGQKRDFSKEAVDLRKRKGRLTSIDNSTGGGGANSINQIRKRSKSKTFPDDIYRHNF